MIIEMRYNEFLRSIFIDYYGSVFLISHNGIMLVNYLNDDAVVIDGVDEI